MFIEKFEKAFYKYDLNEPSGELNSEPLFLFDDIDDAITAAQKALKTWNERHSDNIRKRFYITMMNIKERLNIFEHTKVYTGRGWAASENGEAFLTKLQELGYDGYSFRDNDTGFLTYRLFNHDKISPPRKV